MRRGVTSIVLVVVVAVLIIGTWFFGYGRGQAAGKNAVAADRSAFQSRGTTVAGGGGASGGGGFAGGGSAGGGASPGGGNAGGTGGASQGGLTGLATSVNNGIITLQQANKTTVTVNTTVTTSVQKFVAGKVSDLKTGDFVTVQGDRGSDNSVAAKSVTSISGQLPAGLIPSGGASAAGGGGASVGGAPAASGSAASGSGRSSQGTGGQGGSAGGGGTVGRITRIDGTTLTLQGADGSSVVVKTDAGTTIRTSQPAAIADIKAGDTLLVQADPAGSNTYNARIIYDQGAAGG